MLSQDFDFVLSAEGQRLMAIGANASSTSDPLSLTQQLRTAAGSASASEVAAVVTQIRLRHRARAKFGERASTMYFTADGLEQATHRLVAEHRASRIQPPGASLLDLGCGIGSDLIACAGKGFRVTGVDIDELSARMAAANLRALSLDGKAYRAAAETVETGPFDVLFADPARRKGGARVFDPAAFSPPWPFIESLLATVGALSHSVVKLAPGLDHALIPSHVEAEWVSLDGELKETVLWAPAAGPARRRATVLRAGSEPTGCTDLETPIGDPAVGEPGSCLYEPDPAVIRAHLVSVVADQVEGRLLDPHLAYVTADREVRTPLARGFHIVDVLPFREKLLRAALRERNIGPLTIKKRGISVTPEELRHRLALKGDVAATLVLTRMPGSARALLVEPFDRNR